ncbi:MAG: tRNA (adenosine(37)-N6)-dimethylallyltransferase MiaA [Lysobacterales bacterium]|jgi:tRNA dimethylallyltransferase|nr:MAG: tRNA (adenosine(37)-N6)-dimethylallyltransferase MiaA [Xanthomonadales bacterium]
MSGAHPSRPEAVLLAGPTCSGKTALALRLAEDFPVEIVSVDSAQVYRGMDIGTAKPPAEVRARVPHHLIDVCDPRDPYSAGRFRSDALELIAAIRSRGRIPLLVGGTMLYFRALVRGIAPLPTADPAIRARLEERATRAGWPALHAELAARDPVAAARIRPADGQRIQRALEVLELTGERLSDLQRHATPPAVRFAAFALKPADRAELYARIDARFAAMMEQGFLAEVQALRARGDLHGDLPSLRAVGYRQIWSCLAGERGLEEAVAAAQRASRQLAKRQLTWLRSESSFEAIGTLEDQQLGPIHRTLNLIAGH